MYYLSYMYQSKTDTASSRVATGSAPLISLLPILALAVVFLVSGCDAGLAGTLEREELFSLSLGRLEDEVDMIQLPGIPFDRRTRTVMRDGLVYIANGTTGKIMEFTSYGDLISLYYNPDKNPEPVMLADSNDAEGIIANRRAYKYRFNEVGEIAVTEEKQILIEDRVPEGRGEWDADEGVIHDRIVLRFDRNGRFLDFLGTDGVGGSPFSYIRHIEGIHGGEIAIVTRGPKSWFVYWYTSAGDLLYTVRFFLTELPVPEGEDLIPSLETVYPDREDRRVFLKIDYYSKTVVRESGGGNFVKSRVYIFDIDEERYSGFVEVPKNIWEPETSDFFQVKRFEALYTLLGEAEDTLYLMSSDGADEFHLLMLDTTGRTVARKNIMIKDNELVYRSFYLSPDGILTGFLCTDDKVDIVWWRSDHLLEKSEETGGGSR